MTKEDFLRYVHEAVAAVDENDLERLFPASKQPDLYTLLEVLTGLRGEVKKMAQASLQLNNEVHRLLEKQQELSQVIISAQTEEKEPPKVDPKIEHDLKYILRELIKQEDNQERIAAHLAELPELTIWNINEFKRKLAAWKEGFNLSNRQWHAFMRSTGMYKTGKAGELFNPEYHEAVAVKKDTNKKDGIILETEQIGYIHKNKVVQQAKVVVNRLNPIQVVTKKKKTKKRKR